MGIDPGTDEAWMRYAFRLAQRAEQQGEVPVGAIVVNEDRCIAEGWNASIAMHDPTAHAEILALRSASRELGSWRLEGCTLVVTLEPCAMCASAAVLARLACVIWGTADPKAGFAGSLGNLLDDRRLNHRVAVRGA